MYVPCLSNLEKNAPTLRKRPNRLLRLCLKVFKMFECVPQKNISAKARFSETNSNLSMNKKVRVPKWLLFNLSIDFS